MCEVFVGYSKYVSHYSGMPE